MYCDFKTRFVWNVLFLCIIISNKTRLLKAFKICKIFIWLMKLVFSWELFSLPVKRRKLSLLCLFSLDSRDLKYGSCFEKRRMQGNICWRSCLRCLWIIQQWQTKGQDLNLRNLSGDVTKWKRINKKEGYARQTYFCLFYGTSSFFLLSKGKKSFSL